MTRPARCPTTRRPGSGWLTGCVSPPEQAHYARRKAIVEPVFGQMKTRQHAGRFQLRGLGNIRGEWLLHALCHNLRKLRGGAATGRVVAALG